MYAPDYEVELFDKFISKTKYLFSGPYAFS